MLALAVTALAADVHLDEAAWSHSDASTNLAVSPPSLRAMISLLRAGAAGKTRTELDALAAKSEAAGETTIATGPGVVVLDAYRDDVKSFHPTFATTTHALTIANKISFHGKWREPFDAKLTSNDPFHVDAKHTKTVPMMYAKSLFDGARGPDFDVVAIPYDGGGDLVSTVKLNDALRALGMKHAFCADLAGGVDWSKLASAPEPVCLDDVVHEVHVDVDEHGTTASGSTMSTFELAEGEPEGALRVVADRPFLFFIRDAKGNELFAGRVVDPAPNIAAVDAARARPAHTPK